MFAGKIQDASLSLWLEAVRPLHVKDEHALTHLSEVFHSDGVSGEPAERAGIEFTPHLAREFFPVLRRIVRPSCLLRQRARKTSTGNSYVSDLGEMGIRDLACPLFGKLYFLMPKQKNKGQKSLSWQTKLLLA
jgi:hypothetical protein